MTIYQRGKRYAVSVYDPATQRQRWVGTFDTRAGAETAEAEALRGPTWEQFRWIWLASADLSADTVRLYRRDSKPFIATFGPQHVSELDIDEAQRWGTRQPNKVYETTRALVNRAVEMGFAQDSPFALLRSARSRGERVSAIDAPTLATLAECTEAVWGDYGRDVFGRFLVACAYLQAPWSQLAAVEPADYTGDELILRNPRLAAAEAVTVGEVAREVLDGVIVPAGSPFLFTSIEGRRLDQSRVLYYWHAIRAAAGLPRLEMRELRYFRPPAGPAARRIVVTER